MSLARTNRARLVGSVLMTLPMVSGRLWTCRVLLTTIGRPKDLSYLRRLAPVSLHVPVLVRALHEKLMLMSRCRVTTAPFMV